MTDDPVSSRVILFGGVTGPFLLEEPFDDTWAPRADCTNETWIFDPATDAWSQVA